MQDILSYCMAQGQEHSRATAAEVPRGNIYALCNDSEYKTDMNLGGPKKVAPKIKLLNSTQNPAAKQKSPTIVVSNLRTLVSHVVLCVFPKVIQVLFIGKDKRFAGFCRILEDVPIVSTCLKAACPVSGQAAFLSPYIVAVIADGKLA